jgi:head-tail adaptor
MKKLQAGKLNKKINIIRPTGNADGYGGFSDYFASTSAGYSMIYNNIWANVNTKDSNVTDEFGKVINEVMVEFTTRKNAAKTFLETDIIEYKDILYQINKVSDTNDDDYVKILATNIKDGRT